MDKKIILVLAANPKGASCLRLGEEVRNIEEALRRANQRNAFELMTRFAVTPRSLLQSLSETKPKIVHFCGHSTQKGLILENDRGEAQLASTEAIADTFRILASSGIDCVILNACYSQVQAEEIVKYIPCVVGMSDEIGDAAAIAFAESFYDAIGSGKGYQIAFEMGRNRLSLESSKYEAMLQLETQVKRDKVPQVWLQGWGLYRPRNLAESPEVSDEQLDWTAHYSKEPWKIPTPEMWEQQLFPELARLKHQVDKTYAGQTLDLRSTLSLPAALAVGYTFPETAGYVLQLKQRHDLWRTDVRPAKTRLKIVQSQGEKGPQLLAGIAITAEGWQALEAFRANAEQPFEAVVYLEPESEVGSGAISSAAEAVAYAMSAKDLLRQQKQQYEATCIHLILFAPAGFAFFLGHFLSRLGEIVAYEWNEPNYYPAFHLRAT